MHPEKKAIMSGYQVWGDIRVILEGPTMPPPAPGVATFILSMNQTQMCPGILETAGTLMDGN